jgi:flagellar basal-body rod protein FlgB
MQLCRRSLGSVMLESVTIDALHAALDGLAARQRAVSDNIANVNTPYFQARSVSFEGSLQDALASGSDPLTATTDQTTYSSAPVGATYSNVDLASETVTGVNTQLAYDLALRATGDQFTLLNTAAKDT